MGRDENRCNQQGIDVFGETFDVVTTYTVDNQPDRAMIYLEIRAGQRPPVRVHFPADQVPDLTAIMLRKAQESIENAERARWPGERKG